MPLLAAEKEWWMWQLFWWFISYPPSPCICLPWLPYFSSINHNISVSINRSPCFSYVMTPYLRDASSCLWRGLPHPNKPLCPATSTPSFSAVCMSCLPVQPQSPQIHHFCNHIHFSIYLNSNLNFFLAAISLSFTAMFPVIQILTSLYAPLPPPWDLFCTSPKVPVIPPSIIIHIHFCSCLPPFLDCKLTGKGTMRNWELFIRQGLNEYLLHL